MKMLGAITPKSDFEAVAGLDCSIRSSCAMVEFERPMAM
jgi:hypothetical protein